jgi:hypothetical protein
VCGYIDIFGDQRQPTLIASCTIIWATVCKLHQNSKKFFDRERSYNKPVGQLLWQVGPTTVIPITVSCRGLKWAICPTQVAGKGCLIIIDCQSSEQQPMQGAKKQQ